MWDIRLHLESIWLNYCFINLTNKIIIKFKDHYKFFNSEIILPNQINNNEQIINVSKGNYTIDVLLNNLNKNNDLIFSIDFTQKV